MIAAETAAVVFLALWFAASVVNQFGFEWWKRWKRFDVVGLIPRWTFFAPLPGTTDFHLYYRDVSADGDVGDWRELAFATARSPVDMFWNPLRREKKMLVDAVQQIVQVAAQLEGDGRGVVLTTSYLLLLNAVAALPKAAATRARQFMILESDGYFAAGEPRLVLRSDAHPL